MRVYNRQLCYMAVTITIALPELTLFGSDLGYTQYCPSMRAGYNDTDR